MVCMCAVYFCGVYVTYVACVCGVEGVYMYGECTM